MKWSDCAGEVVFNLGRYYRKAFKRGIAIKLFEDPGGAAASRARRQQKVHKLEVVDTEDDLPPPEDSEDGVQEKAQRNLEARDSGMPGDGQIKGNTTATTTEVITTSEGRVSATRSESYFEGENPLRTTTSTAAGGGGELGTLAEYGEEDGDGKGPGPRARAGTYVKSIEELRAEDEMEAARKAQRRKEEKQTPWWWIGRVPHHSDSESDDDESGSDSDDDDDGDNTPLLGKSAEEEEEEEEEEMKEQVNAFKNMTGMWDIDPPDSDWVHLTKKDHNTDKITPMGSLAISLQIWPKDKANALPSGPARNEPNVNPMLPPPVGRLQWSWNPFVLGSELCGPKLCATFTCCLLAVAFILLMIFCQPFLNIIINLVFVVFGA